MTKRPPSLKRRIHHLWSPLSCLQVSNHALRTLSLTISLCGQLFNQFGRRQTMDQHMAKRPPSSKRRIHHSWSPLSCLQVSNHALPHFLSLFLSADGCSTNSEDGNRWTDIWPSDPRLRNEESISRGLHFPNFRCATMHFMYHSMYWY